jgi:hypothetical protein
VRREYRHGIAPDPDDSTSNAETFADDGDG